MKQVVSSFYKYADLDDPEKLKGLLFNLCKSLEIKGRILLGKEGINGSVYGYKRNIGEFKKELRNYDNLSDLEFKEQETKRSAFSRLYISVRKEIVHLGHDVDLRKTASFLTPKELKDWLDNKKDIVLLDARNGYETRIGKFRNAIELDIKNFRDFPGKIKNIEGYKDKKIVTYCTGGIRCEKASALLVENGFNDVWQLKGGILNYGKEFPNTYWQGKCFVFDERLAIDLNSDDESVPECELCSKKMDRYINCHNIECDKLFACCDGCMAKFNASCCEKCSLVPRRRKKNTQVLAV